MREHAYFNRLSSEKSGIRIDHDDVTSYGPETTDIIKPNDEWWYLFTVHNYSYHWSKDKADAHMNYDGQTNVEIQMYGESVNIKPVGDSDNHWWDVAVLHMGVVYIINSAPRSRATHFAYDLTTRDCQTIIDQCKVCKRKYQVSRYASAASVRSYI